MDGENVHKLLSAVIYLIVFFMSCFFTALAHQSNERKNKIEFTICSIIAIVIPCVLAGSRNISVGTDTQNYNEIFISIKHAASLEESYSYWGIIDGLSFPFILLNRIVSKLFGSFSIMLFIFELFAVIPIYIIAFYYKSIAPAWVVLFVYYMMFYNTSLNISRQSIAAALMMLSLMYIYKQQFTSF